MAKNITFKKSTIDLIRRLTTINPSILIEKDDTKITIKSSDSSGSVAYMFEAESADFGFTGDEVGFLDFNEFHQLLNVYKNPTIMQDEDDALDLVISENRSKISYRLTNSEVIKRGFNEIEFGDSDVEFILTTDDIKHINKMLSLVNAESVKMAVADGKIKFTLFSKKSTNTFEEVYDSDSANDKEFSINLTKDTFVMIPADNYRISAKEEGIVKFSMIRDDSASVDIYVAEEST